MDEKLMKEHNVQPEENFETEKFLSSMREIFGDAVTESEAVAELIQEQINNSPMNREQRRKAEKFMRSKRKRK